MSMNILINSLQQQNKNTISIKLSIELMYINQKILLYQKDLTQTFNTTLFTTKKCL